MSMTSVFGRKMTLQLLLDQSPDEVVFNKRVLLIQLNEVLEMWVRGEFPMEQESFDMLEEGIMLLLLLKLLGLP
jgi:hypothetical protein